jgi:hypothetical protein
VAQNNRIGVKSDTLRLADRAVGAKLLVASGISGPTSNGLGFQVYSTSGWIVCSEGSPAGPTQNKPWELNIGSERSLAGPEACNSVFRGFDILREPCVTRICGPHWFPVLLSAAFAAAPWFRRTWKFSLRTLLIATTLVAVVLGLIVWLG